MAGEFPNWEFSTEEFPCGINFLVVKHEVQFNTDNVAHLNQFYPPPILNLFL
jgi:hypothetical protein